ncbi:ketopantoate reductase family protein [Jeotgalibacillus haloalkalitolerans]|uniref:2-dehydropantoate 2-reductase n=1 Tax=Jeotgalibacillus haloalkalitolerans TaxID=3104292 RepID=A0ABU5KJZ7_9BACL|nr:2-dehydropantoate 2-reductase [Jeotgalibacillus sp. HH7-29]MDZ5711558.1 2-dehydropantoate 2-reductase [Jeotgalibacillus sp. HH7-29]
MIIIRIHMIGAGSIGLLFAHRLSMCGHTIHIATRTDEQAGLLNRHGVLNGTEQKVSAGKLEHTTFEKTDAVIIAVKQYHLNAIASDIQRIPEHVPVIFLQNGMSHLELLSTLPHQHIFVSTVEHGAKKLNAYSVQHNGVGWWRIACFKGDNEKVKQIISCDHPDFPIAFEAEYLSLLTIKLIKNLMINPITAVFQVRNGVLAENQHFRKMMHSLYEELALIFPDAAAQCPFEAILDLCVKTAENESSMLSDIKAGRKTEVESMTGYAMKIAEQKDIKPEILPFLEQGILAIQRERGTG